MVPVLGGSCRITWNLIVLGGKPILRRVRLFFVECYLTHS